MRYSLPKSLLAVLLLSACASTMDSEYGIHGANVGAESTSVAVDEAPMAPASTGMTEFGLTDYGTALETPETPEVSQIAAPDYSGAETVSSQQTVFAQEAGALVYFDYDSSALTPEARKTLEAQASWLKAYPAFNVTLEGHADERGTREYNLALGERRAASMKAYLISLGIDGNRLRTVSYGKERPAVLGSTPQAWAQNRRGVTVLD